MELGWECGIPFAEGLRKTVSWYLNPAPDTMTEHVMIFGGGGWIGQQFARLLHDSNTSYSLALSRPGSHPDEEVECELIKLSPTHVISFIGRTHGPGANSIEYLEGGPDKLNENLRDNLYAPWLLAALCQRLGIHFTYVGTGCLFQVHPCPPFTALSMISDWQYDDTHPVGGSGYGEDDVPNYVGNSYGVAKLFTDRMMHHFDDALNVRVRLPINFNVDKRNLICKVLPSPISPFLESESGRARWRTTPPSSTSRTTSAASRTSSPSSSSSCRSGRRGRSTSSTPAPSDTPRPSRPHPTLLPSMHEDPGFSCTASTWTRTRRGAS